MHARLITSPHNPQLKQLRRDARRARACLVEGAPFVRHALGWVEELYVAPELLRGEGAQVAARAVEHGARVHELSEGAFASISTLSRPDGLLALVRPRTHHFAELDLGPRPLVLVAEAVERPGNLGTIVRSACAAGASALVLCDPQTDPFHPEAIRASAGAVFHLPVAHARRDEVLDRLPAYVGTPAAARPLWEADLAGPAALVVGSEKRGVTRGWIERGVPVAIPMPGGAMDSLNVGVAAGILLFEAARQRAQTATARSRRSHAPSAKPAASTAAPASASKT